MWYSKIQDEDGIFCLEFGPINTVQSLDNPLIEEWLLIHKQQLHMSIELLSWLQGRIEAFHPNEEELIQYFDYRGSRWNIPESLLSKFFSGIRHFQGHLCKQLTGNAESLDQCVNSFAHAMMVVRGKVLALLSERGSLTERG